MYTEQVFEESGYTGEIIRCELFIGEIENRHPEKHPIEPVYYFEYEDELHGFFDEISDSSGRIVCDIADGQWLEADFGRYQVENGCVDYDSAYCRSSIVLVD